MDLLKAIRELHEEKKRIDRTIARLERSAAESGAPARRGSKPAGRRGRKRMSESERRQVSERMVQYWAWRRAAATIAAQPEAPPDPAPDSGPIS